MGDETELDISYWPLFRGAVAAALVALAAQVVGVVWFGLQAGAEIEIDRFWFLPYLKVITTSVSVFNSIIKWSTLATALAVTVFAVAPFLRRKRLQTQMGRGFGFLDLALLSGLHLWGERINPGATLPTRLMLYVFVFGLVGFVLVTFLVVDTYRLQVREGHRSAEGLVLHPNATTP